MDFTMQQLEDMDELDRLYLFEDIPEEDLKAHIESLPEDEREALLALIPEEVRCDMCIAIRPGYRIKYLQNAGRRNYPDRLHLQV